MNNKFTERLKIMGDTKQADSLTPTKSKPVETVYKNKMGQQQSFSEMEPATSEIHPKTDKKNRVPSATSTFDRNQSDIFAPLKEQATINAIFSIGGAPSRKIFRKNIAPISQNSNTVLPLRMNDEASKEKLALARKSEPIETKSDATIERSRARPDSGVRNPLTGFGLNSNDEYNKVKSAKRRDGNPLLGSGYEDAPEGNASNNRIPPGGYSHVLW